MTFKTLLKIMILPVIGMILIGLPFVDIIRNAQKPPVAIVSAPGSATFELEQPVKVTIWHKVAGVSADHEFRVGENSLPVGLSISIRDLDSNTTVPIVDAAGATRTVNEVVSTSLFKAELDPGRYEIIARTAEEEIDLEVRPQLFKASTILMMIGGSLLGSILFLAGVIYAVVVIIRELTRKPSPTQSHT